MACNRICECGVRIADCDWPFDVCPHCLAERKDSADNFPWDNEPVEVER